MYLGKSMNDTEVTQFMQKFFVSYDMHENENSSTIEFNVNFNGEVQKFRIEEVYGMILRYVKYLADKFSKSDIHECFITVPSFFGYKEKKALDNAATMTGLKLIGFVNENTAASIPYFIDRRVNTTRNVIFYNMGASYTQVSLIQNIEGSAKKIKVKISNSIKKLYLILHIFSTYKFTY